MIKKMFLVLSIWLFVPLMAGEARIAAAADLVYCFGEIKKVFEARYPGDKLSAAFGSSGKAYTQIQNGAPYDLFFSADMGYVAKLRTSGMVVSEPKPYAYGRLGMWAPKEKGIDVRKGIEILLDPRVTKIAIADPAHAPYGVAAVATLKSQKLYDRIFTKLVLGENVSHAAQFVSSGAADVGIIPISLAYSDVLQKSGTFQILPREWHNDIVQGYGLTKIGAANPTAKKFELFVGTPEARVIFKKYGFTLPNE